MEDKEMPEELTPLLRGDKVLRIRRRRPRRRLRLTPDIPGVFKFLRQIATETPLIPLSLALVGLWLLSSWGVYLAERGANEQINSYGYALWWTFTAMQTQGANSPGPITAPGMIIGSIWSIFSTVAFFGVIIATLYAYFMLPKRRPSREIVSALQYNLEELENLSVDELEVLRDTTVRIVNAQIREREQKSSGQ
ncbi:MAG: two pore domain potassium channel family protein [Dehalococcoidia bacterium]|nr:MAG: two pore domain potassium channel family protein [Dehalococcoidia bacterium]